MFDEIFDGVLIFSFCKDASTFEPLTTKEKKMGDEERRKKFVEHIVSPYNRW